MLQSLVLPPAMSAEVELAALQMRGQPVTDAEELLPVCYRCAATNVLLNTQAGARVCMPWITALGTTQAAANCSHQFRYN